MLKSLAATSVLLLLMGAAPVIAQTAFGSDRPAYEQSAHQNETGNTDNERASDLLKSQVASYQAFNSGNKTPYVSLSAADQVHDMGAGLTILAGDPYWERGGKSTFHDKQFQAVANAGFKTVRVPLAAFSHLKADGSLDETWLKKLDWVIDEASRLNLTIILSEDDGDICSQDLTSCGPKLGTVWFDLSERYRTAPNNVVFELLADAKSPISNSVLNGWMPDLLAVARSDNATRNIIVDPTVAGGVSDLTSFSPPDDSHLIVGVRYTAATADAAAVTAHIGTFAAWSKGSGKPVLLAFGTTAPAEGDRALWAQALTQAANGQGLGHIYLNYNDDLGVYDSATGQWDEPVVAALTSTGSAAQ